MLYRLTVTDGPARVCGLSTVVEAPAWRTWRTGAAGPVLPAGLLDFVRDWGHDKRAQLVAVEMYRPVRVRRDGTRACAIGELVGEVSL